jgi:hypothetical protein
MTATIGASLALAFIPAAAPVAVYAATDIEGSLCSGAELDVSGTATCGTEGTTRVQGIIESIINIFSIIVGVVAVIMIIYGGFQYISSGGDSSKIGTAKNTIIYAVIGLVIVALAQFVVRFVLEKAIG